MSNFSMLTRHLDLVSRHIRLNEDERKHCRMICQMVEDELARRIRESSSVIGRLFTGSVHTGSYFNGVKVSKPDEFDIDLVLTIPLDKNKYFINNTHPGFVSVKVDKAIEEQIKNKTWNNGDIKKLVNEAGFLDETLLRREVESLLNRLFPQGTIHFYSPKCARPVKARLRKNGPAFTMVVESPIPIDIDFVFVFCIPVDKVPPKPIRKKVVKSTWFIVPKESTSSRNWRISFPWDEKNIINSNYNLKPVYKLLKALRDAQKWNLASYHIKTLFLWKAEKEDSSYWRQHIGPLFYQMLTELMLRLNRNEIQFYWHSKNNMLESYNSVNVYNMSNRCQEILRKINLFINQVNESAMENFILNEMFRLDLERILQQEESSSSCAII